MSAVAGWVEGRKQGTEKWGEALGEATAEKRWLAASLCKHVSVQHEKHDGGGTLPVPDL